MPFDPTKYEELEKQVKLAAEQGLVDNDTIRAFNQMSDAVAQQYPGYFPMKSMRTLGILDPDTERRLINTGITPGTAAEFANAHIESLKKQGIDPHADGPGRTNAIYDIYKTAAGRTDLSSRDFFAEQWDYQSKKRRDTLGGRFEEAALSGLESVVSKGTSLLGVVAPETANTVNERIGSTFNVNREGGMFTPAGGGALAGEALTLAATGGQGAGFNAAFYGGMGAGGVRQDVADLRGQGQEISGWQEFKAATLTGGIEAASGLIKDKIFGALGRIGGPTAAKAIAQGNTTVTRQLVRTLGLMLSEGGEEAVTQLITNRIAQGYNPEQAILEGVGESFISGAILAPFGAFMGQQQQRQQQQQQQVDAAQVAAQAQVQGQVDGGSSGDAIPVQQDQGQKLLGPAEQPAGLLEAPAPRFVVDESGVAQDTRVDVVPAEAYTASEAEYARKTDQLIRDTPDDMLPRMIDVYAEGSPDHNPNMLAKLRAEQARRQSETQRETQREAERPSRRSSPLQQQAAESEQKSTKLEADVAVEQERQRKLEERLIEAGVMEQPKGKPTMEFKDTLKPSEVDDYAALLSPREDLTDADEIDADIAMQRGNREAALKRPNDDFELTELPVEAFEVRNPKEGLKKGAKYVRQDPATAPPIVAGIPAANDNGKLVTTDGDTRLKAALLRGDKTVRVYVPKGDLAELQTRLAEKERGKRAEAQQQTKVTSPEIEKLDAQMAELVQQEAAARDAQELGRARRIGNAINQLIKQKDVLTRKQIDEEAQGIISKEQSRDALDVLEDKNVRTSLDQEAEVSIQKQEARDRREAAQQAEFEQQTEDQLADTRQTDQQRRAEARAKRTEAGKQRVKAEKAAQTRKVEQPDVTAPAAKKKGRPDPVAAVQDDARDYMRAFKPEGRTDTPPNEYVEVNTLRARRVAKAYDRMEHKPNDPEVKASYDALKNETANQFEHLLGRGMTFEFVDSNPYNSSQEMAADVADNRNLKVFRTSKGFGTDAAVNNDHPLLELIPAEMADKYGLPKDLTYNDVFRAVHDYYGHAKNGYGFGARGEENAWRAHSQMYTDTARPAMTTETRGQNSWVNFGPYGQQNRADPANTRFAEQKAGLLPAEFWWSEKMERVDTTATARAADPASKTADYAEKAAKAAEKEALPVGPKKRWVPRLIEDLITPVITRIMKLSPKVGMKAVEMQYQADTARERINNELRTKVENLLPALKKAGQLENFKELVLNQQHEEALALLDSIDPKLTADFKAVTKQLELIHDQAKQAGVLGEGLENYWPRYIKDYKSYKQAMGEDEGIYKEAIDNAQAARGRPLTNEEKMEVINSVVQGYGPVKPGRYGPANARTRTVEAIHPANLKYYVDPFASLFRYVDGMVYAVERAKFLGRHVTSTGDIEASVGSVIQQEIEDGNMTSDEQREMQDLLTARFIADMRPTPKHIRVLKQIGYTLTLGQFRSVLTQLTDVATTLATHGVMPTLKAVMQQFGSKMGLKPGEKRIVMEEIGIHDHGEEFKDVGVLARATNAVLKATGFTKVDRFGKETRLNAAWQNFQNAANNPGSPNAQRIAREYQEHFDKAFGDGSWDGVLADLRAGRRTDKVGLLLTLDITKVQPVNMWQMPKDYLTAARGRIFYTMKTFMLKQIDHVRRDMISKMTTPGQRKDGLRAFGRYMVLFTAFAMGTDWLKDELKELGRMFFEDGYEESPDEKKQFGERLTGGLLQTIGLNRWTTRRFGEDPVAAVAELVTPPLGFVKDIATDVRRVFEGRFFDKDKPVGIRTLRDIPIIGELIYHNTPLGDGWYAKERDRDRRFSEMVTEAKDEAKAAFLADNIDLANDIVDVINEKNRDRWMARMDQWRDGGEVGEAPRKPNNVTVKSLVKDTLEVSNESD